MKNYWKFGLLFFGSALFLQACSLGPCGGSKDGFINKYNAFMAEVSDADWPVSDPKWKKADQQFKTFLEECMPEYEEEMTRKERRKVWGAATKYYYKRFGAGTINELFNKNESWLEDLERFSEEELKDLVDEIEDDVDSWVDRLEQIFSDEK